MATVPYNPVPTARPTGAGNNVINIRADAGAFGGLAARATEQLGGAVQGFGRTLEHAGDELFRRAVALQELENDNIAKQADADYIIESGKLHAEYNSLQGKSAVDAFPKYAEDLKGLRESMRAQLPNDSTRRIFDNATKGTMARSIFNGAGHAASQNKRWTLGTSVSRIDAIKEGVLQDPTNDDLFQDGVRQIHREVRGTQAAVAGWGPEQTDQEVEKDISSLSMMRIIGLARTDPFKARELLEASRDHLRSGDVMRAQKIVMDQEISTGARNIAEIVSKKGDSLEDQLQQGSEISDEMFPDNAPAKDAVRARIRERYNDQYRIKRDNDFNNTQTINDALQGKFGGGKVPTTEDELKAIDPSVAKAWENLDIRKQNSYRKAMASRARGDVFETVENIKLTNQILGKASGSREEQEEFLMLDPALQEPRLTNSQMKQVLAAQRQFKAKPELDPRVTRAMKIFQPQLDALKMDKDELAQFRGAMQTLVQDYIGTHNKQPTADEVKIMGNGLLQEEALSKGWFGTSFGRSKVRLFQGQVLYEDVQREKANPAYGRAGVPPPTEEEIRLEVIRRRFNELYGGSIKKKGDKQ